MRRLTPAPPDRPPSSALNRGRARASQRLTVALCAALLLLTACKRRSTAEDAPPPLPADLLSAFEVADPRAAVQLTRGFYGLEGNTWRWTSSRFGVVLAPPAGAAERGARLELKFTIPGVVFERLGPMTLRTSFEGQALEPQTYAQAGDQVYSRLIPAARFGGGDAVSVEFTTDKSLPPGDGDTRELALVVTSVGLLPQ